jgi:hypothetical protein
VSEQRRGIIAAASLPNPPLLLPGTTGGLVAEVEELRAACLAAISAVLTSEPESIVLIGGIRPDEGEHCLSLEVGRALLSQAGCGIRVEEVTVGTDLPPSQCELVGEGIAELSERTAVVVMADGSARRSVKAPGYLDERAVPFDSAVWRALVTGEWSSLIGLDPDLAEQLMVAGRAPWQVFSAAMLKGPTVPLAAVVPHYNSDPFGVWYPVLSYLSADPTPGALSQPS